MSRQIGKLNFFFPALVLGPLSLSLMNLAQSYINRLTVLEQLRERVIN